MKGLSSPCIQSAMLHLAEKLIKGEKIPGLSDMMERYGQTTNPVSDDEGGAFVSTDASGGSEDATGGAPSLSQSATAGLASFEKDTQRKTNDPSLSFRATGATRRGQRQSLAKAKGLGVELVFVEEASGKQLPFPAYYAPASVTGGKGVLYVEAGASDYATLALFHHEWTHHFEKTDPSGWLGLLKLLKSEAPNLFRLAGNSYFHDEDAQGVSVDPEFRDSESAMI